MREACILRILLPEGFTYSTSFPSVTVDCVPSLALNAGALLRALRKKHPSPGGQSTAVGLLSGCATGRGQSWLGISCLAFVGQTLHWLKASGMRSAIWLISKALRSWTGQAVRRCECGSIRVDRGRQGCEQPRQRHAAKLQTSLSLTYIPVGDSADRVCDEERPEGFLRG